jgi:polyribonucleotide nucleotidyltransferase
MKIKPEKIREVIGTGGKVIQKIVADTGAKVDIEDDGSVFISAVDKKAIEAAREIIAGIVFEPEVGAVYNAKVTRIIPIGAFVEYAPGREGLVHISKLAKERTEKVEDVCKEGDEFLVKFLGIDEKGRANLSRKDAL